MKEAKKTDRVGFRLKPRHRNIIDQSAALGFGSSKTAIIEALLDAFADALEREGTVTPPLYVTTKAISHTTSAMLNEAPPSTQDDRLQAAIKLLEGIQRTSSARRASPHK